jgi:hypothetical protein
LFLDTEGREPQANTYFLTLRARNPRPTLVLLDLKARIAFTSTTQRSGPSITPQSRLIETRLIIRKTIKIQGNKTDHVQVDLVH